MAVLFELDFPCFVAYLIPLEVSRLSGHFLLVADCVAFCPLLILYVGLFDLQGIAESFNNIFRFL